MIAGVADTRTAVWYLYRSPRLSTAAKNFIDHAAQNRDYILVSPISLAEIVYLIEKGSLKVFAYDDLISTLSERRSAFREAPLNTSVLASMWKVPRAQVPDMPDRIIAATAMHFGVPVTSRDAKICSSVVETLW